MKLTQIGISNFRSIGEEFVTIDLTKKLNVLVGANNCGKSNVLRGIKQFGQWTAHEIEFHFRNKNLKPVFQVTAESDNTDLELFRRIREIRIQSTQTPNGEFVSSHPFGDVRWQDFEPFWSEYVKPGYVLGVFPESRQIEEIKQATALRVWQNLRAQYPRVELVPQFRKIGPGSSYEVAGGGVTDLLAQWQHPKIGEDSNREKFQSVESLIQKLVELSSAQIEVNASDGIVISSNGLRLPLASFGTGIHELIILAIAVLQHDDALICIEEPEIHLHPLLQRRFLEFLRSEATTNRYVLTTHSPALIAPGDDVAVTHLWLENGVTKSRRVATTGHSLEALRDLGAKASDLLQANSVIWVEGPSDRIYLNRWLQLLHPGLKEGIDYAVMFYGGRLLSYLSTERDPDTDASSASPEDTADLIQLLRINQYSAILIDSDRRKDGAAINATKQRIAAECEASRIPCWITSGREIENCLPAPAITAAFSEIAGKDLPAVSLAPCDSIETSLRAAFRATWPRASYYENQKPQRARVIARHLTAETLSPEVRDWVDRLARTIRHESTS